MKIMFICTGNICRSAMAEGMMKKLAKDNAVEAAKYYDVNIEGHRATNIRKSKIKEMDIILCATESHKQSVLYMYPELKEKVFTMKEYAELDKNGQDMDIKDPWGYDMNVYQNCAEEIEKCLIKIIEKIQTNFL